MFLLVMTWRLLSRKLSQPPHKGIRYTSLLMNNPLANIFLVLKFETLPRIFNAFSLVLICLTNEFLLIRRCSVHFKFWEIIHPKRFSHFDGSRFSSRVVHLAASGNHIDTMQTSELCLHLSFLAKLQIYQVIVASQCSFFLIWIKLFSFCSKHTCLC